MIRLRVVIDPAGESEAAPFRMVVHNSPTGVGSTISLTTCNGDPWSHIRTFFSLYFFLFLVLHSIRHPPSVTRPPWTRSSVFHHRQGRAMAIPLLLLHAPRCQASGDAAAHAPPST